VTRPAQVAGLEPLLEAADRALASGQELPAAQWQRALDELGRLLHRPMGIADAEAVEAVVKAYLRVVVRSRLTAAEAHFLAAWQRELGFVMKYKSYGVKCATPLGYSVFLLNPGEGFSFQRHLTRKTEIFHILEPLEGALVFLCTSPQWESAYEEARFERWLAGERDPKLEGLARRPEAGDVFHVSELGVVHTVLGCVLEEFATVSTDMVERLHDQNLGRPVPQPPRDALTARLRALPGRPPRTTAVEPGSIGLDVRGGEIAVYRLGSGVMDALRVHVARGSVELAPEPERMRIVFAVNGSASCRLRAEADPPGAAQPAIAVRGGDLLLLAPHVAATIDAADHVACSIHGIEPELALA
jgi:hypothetical protein